MNRFLRHARRSVALGVAASAWLAFSATADAGDAGAIADVAPLPPGKSLYSQGNEERIVRHFFGDRRDGVFVDAGAAHYQVHSTTYYLEKHLGWSGIAIDALPVYARDYERNRPRTRFLNFIVTDHTGTLDPFYVVGGGWPTSSTLKEWAEARAAEDPKKTVGEIRVPTTTLNDLLEEHGIERVDFVSMDIEGAELQALRGFDLERYRPELLCIETAGMNRGAVIAYMAERGYHRIEAYGTHDPVNVYFTRRPSP